MTAARNSGVISMAKARSIARFIQEQDSRFAKVVGVAGPSTIGRIKSPSTNFSSLAESILSQQLSVKASNTIISRIAKLSGGRLTASGIAKLKDRELRQAGCSGAKARAIKELSEATLSQAVPMRSLHTMSDEAIFEALLPLFGIGKWTVEMFLMFQLGRLDIWPVGDLGVRRGWERLHGLKEEISPSDLAKRGEKFAPYRSHVAWYCWRALDLR